MVNLYVAFLSGSPNLAPTLCTVAVFSTFTETSSCKQMRKGRTMRPPIMDSTEKFDRERAYSLVAKISNSDIHLTPRSQLGLGKLRGCEEQRNLLAIERCKRM